MLVYVSGVHDRRKGGRGGASSVHVLMKFLVCIPTLADILFLVRTTQSAIYNAWTRLMASISFSTSALGPSEQKEYLYHLLWLPNNHCDWLLDVQCLSPGSPKTRTLNASLGLCQKVFAVGKGRASGGSEAIYQWLWVLSFPQNTGGNSCFSEIQGSCEMLWWWHGTIWCKMVVTSCWAFGRECG